MIGDSGPRGICTVFLGIDCPISNELLPELERLATFAAERRIEFYGVLSDPYATVDDLTGIRREFGISFPVLFDADGALAERLRPRVTPEVFVHDGSGTPSYRGRVDDRSESRRIGGDGPRQRDLFECLSALTQGARTPLSQAASGCAFEGWPAPGEMAINWSQHVSPILEAHCADCHSDEGAAPFPLHRYEDAARRSRMIARVTLERTMPPSLADPTGSGVMGTHRLDDRSIAVLQRWSDLGAPSGPDASRLRRSSIDNEETLGPPDVIVSIEQTWTIPGDGRDQFRAFSLPALGSRGVHLVAAELRPSAPRAIRFAQLMTDPGGRAHLLDAATEEPGYSCEGGLGITEYASLATWPIGRPLDRLPEGASRTAPGSDPLVLWLHAHPQGKPVQERASIALWFGDSAEHSVVSMESIVLSEGDRTEEHGMVFLRTEQVLTQDRRLVSLMPRLGHLGKSLRVTSVSSAGEESSLLLLDRWEPFRPERFSPRAPQVLRSGSRLIVEAAFGSQERAPTPTVLPPTPLPTTEELRGGLGLLFVEYAAAETNSLPSIGDSR